MEKAASFEQTRDREQEPESISPTASTSGKSNPCPICLAQIDADEESYLDHCFHKFCYKCITQWTKVAASRSSEPPVFVTCPLCKTKNSSIIYRYNGSSFERHYIRDIYTDSVYFSEAHKFRIRRYFSARGAVDNIFNVQRFWKSRKYLNPNRWLGTWVRREVQALMQEHDVELIAHHILGMVDLLSRMQDGPRNRKQPEVVQAEFRAAAAEAARPFLAGRAERFVDELELFLASGLNLQAYDEVYIQHVNKIEADAADEEQPRETSPPIVAPPNNMFIFDVIPDED